MTMRDQKRAHWRYAPCSQRRLLRSVALLLPLLACAQRCAAAGGPVLENEALRISFADDALGFDCLSIENKLVVDGRFVDPSEQSLGWPGLWQIALSAPAKDGQERRELFLSNKDSGGICSARLTHGRTGERLTLRWQRIALADEPNCLEVTATISLAKGRAPSEWRVRVKNKSKTWGTDSVTFPILRTICKPGVADVLLPTGALGGTLYRRNVSSYEGYYPYWACAVQCMAFNLGQAGLYVGAHDGDANVKTLKLTADQHVMIEVLAKNQGVPRKSDLPSFPVVIAAYEGDWWQAAKIYRAWALQQRWARLGWLANRKDVPQRFLDIGFWLTLDSASIDYLRSSMAEAKRFFAPLKLAVHWYNWHQIQFDTRYPEFFPAKPGVAEFSQELRAEGISVMPYVNAHLWDTGLPSFAQARPAAVSDRDGKLLDGPADEPGRFLTVMCPATEFWQKTMAELCRRLVDELGVSGIYLDQLGGTRAKLCFDPSHGHALGGGNYWTEGYRQMVDEIRKASALQDVFLTSEMFAEQYIDLIHGFLIAHLYRHPDDVPLIQAVYSGYTTCFGCLESERDDLNAFAALQGGSFVWGVQPGWLKVWLLEQGDKAQLARKLALYRMAAKQFLIYGELVDEVRFAAQPDKVAATVYLPVFRIRSYAAEYPSLYGGIWRTHDEKSLGVVAMNVDSRPQRVRFSLDVNQWLKSRKDTRLGIFRVLPEGDVFERELTSGSKLNFDETLDAREPLILAVRPIEADLPAIDVASNPTGTSNLAKLTRGFDCDREMARLKLRVRLENDLIECLDGEKAAATMVMVNRGNSEQTVQVKWHDGAIETVALPANKETTIKHEVLTSGRFKRSQRYKVNVTVGELTRVYPFFVLRAAPVEMSLRNIAGGAPTGSENSVAVLDPTDASADARIRAMAQAPPGLHPEGHAHAIESNGTRALRVTLQNNSRLAQSGHFDLKLPAKWKYVSRGNFDSIAPGDQIDMEVQCEIPAYAEDALETIGGKVGDYTTSEQVTVLKGK